MTDKEMLDLCRTAFKAIPIAAKARKVLKELGRKPEAYAGNGSHVLAKNMVKMLDEHFGGSGGENSLPRK